MSEENVEIVRTALEASQRGEGRYDLLDPDFAWDFSAYAGLDVAPEGTGRDNFRRLMERYRRAWLDYHMALKELIDAGSEVVVVRYESWEQVGDQCQELIEAADKGQSSRRPRRGLYPAIAL